MSYTRFEVDHTALDSRGTALWQPAKFLRVAIWSVLNAGLVFAEHLAEMLAPLVLLAGIIWWVVPHGLAAITLEGQAADMLQIVRSRLPHDLYIDGSYYSASVLIMDGLWLIGVVAICRTLSTALAMLLLDRR